MGKGFYAFFIILGVFLSCPVWAQSSLTEPEEKLFYEALNRASITKMSLITAASKKGVSSAEACRLANSAIKLDQASIEEAFSMIQRFRSEGKSTDTLHATYVNTIEYSESAESLANSMCSWVRAESIGDSDKQAGFEIEGLEALFEKAIKKASTPNNDPLNGCGYASLALRYANELQQWHEIMFDSGQNDPEAATYKANLTRSQAIRSETETLKTSLCAKVSFKSQPAKPPVAKSEEEKLYDELVVDVLSNVLTQQTQFMQGALKGEWGEMCNAQKTAQLNLMAAIERLSQVITSRKAEGKGTNSLETGQKQLREMLQTVDEAEAKYCQKAKNSERLKAIEAESNIFLSRIEKSMEEVNLAIKSKDRPRICRAARSAQSDNIALFKLLEEYVQLDADAIDLNQLKEIRQDYNEIIAKLEVLKKSAC